MCSMPSSTRASGHSEMTTTEIAPVVSSSRFAGVREFWHYFAVNRGAVLGLVVIVLLVLIAIFALRLALVLVTILGPGLFNAMFAIAITLLPFFARLTRGAVMVEKNREYVTSARLAGASHLRLMVMTILPNCLAPLIVQATLCFSDA